VRREVVLTVGAMVPVCGLPGKAAPAGQFPPVVHRCGRYRIRG